MATDRWVGAASALTITEKFVLGLGLLGAVLAAIGQAIGGPIVGLGVALLGVAGVVAGVHSVVTREHLTWTDTASHRHSRVSARRHTGAPAMIYGLLFVVIGLVVFVTGLAVAIGRGDELASRAFDNAGVALMFVGGLYCLAGVATTISRWTRF
ncbi:MAG: hypothetical protein GY724_02575, partial [Actinomycetia bacterium]|nr:hypothetical protein [Actinomycetes bacterium]